MNLWTPSCGKSSHDLLCQASYEWTIGKSKYSQSSDPVRFSLTIVVLKIIQVLYFNPMF